MKRTTVLLSGLLVCGCYKYAPVEAGAIVPGMGVRARLTAATAERIAPLLGTNTREIAGPVVERNGGTIIVEVPTVAQAGVAGSTQTLYQRVTLAPSDVLELERRTLDKQKTAVIVGALAAATISTAAAALHNSPGIDSPPSQSGNEIRIPVIRWRLF